MAGDDNSLEQTAISMIEEFKNSMNEGDMAGLVVENFRQVGAENHKHLLNKAIQHATSSVAKHAETRKLLAEILLHLICEPDKDSKAKDYTVSMESGQRWHGGTTCTIFGKLTGNTPEMELPFNGA